MIRVILAMVAICAIAAPVRAQLQGNAEIEAKTERAAALVERLSAGQCEPALTGWREMLNAPSETEYVAAGNAAALERIRLGRWPSCMTAMEDRQAVLSLLAIMYGSPGRDSRTVAETFLQSILGADWLDRLADTDVLPSVGIRAGMRHAFCDERQHQGYRFGGPNADDQGFSMTFGLECEHTTGIAKFDYLRGIGLIAVWEPRIDPDYVGHIGPVDEFLRILGEGLSNPVDFSALIEALPQGLTRDEMLAHTQKLRVRVVRRSLSALLADFYANAPREDVAAVRAFADAWEPRPLDLSD